MGIFSALAGFFKRPSPETARVSKTVQHRREIVIRNAVDVTRLSHADFSQMARRMWPGIPPALLWPSAMVRDTHATEGGIRETETAIRDMVSGGAANPFPPGGFRNYSNFFMIAQTDLQYQQAQGAGRWLSINVPHAEGIVTALCTSILGTGLTVVVTPQEASDESDARALELAKELNTWCQRKRFQQRFSQAVFRMFRDGEAFMRWFPSLPGGGDFRFIEPEWILTPPNPYSDGMRLDRWYGVEVSADDYETPIQYWVWPNYKPGTPLTGDNPAASPREWLVVPAEEMVQMVLPTKLSNSKRGIPFLWTCREELLRLELVLRMMGQSVINLTSISMIVEYPEGTDTERAAKALNSEAPTDGDAPPGVLYETEPQGSAVIHALPGVKATTPTVGLHFADLCEVVAAMVRQIAAQTQLPVSMVDQHLTAKYSNEAVTLDVAMRRIESLQAHCLLYAEDALQKVLANMIGEDAQEFRVVVTGPAVTAPSLKTKAEVLTMMQQAGAISAQTMNETLDITGIPWAQEQERLNEDSEKVGAGMYGTDEEGEEEEEEDEEEGENEN